MTRSRACWHATRLSKFTEGAAIIEKSFSVCVFCGAREGTDPYWVDMATQVGRTLGKRGITMVYGGGGVGLMGAVARGALAEGGHVIGVIPRMLMAQEQGNLAVDRLERVDSMAERKIRLIDLSDAFLTLPGGLGTLDELFEVMTLHQIGVHDKPTGMLNVRRYFDPLLAVIEHFGRHGFVGQRDLDYLTVGEDVDQVLDILQAKVVG